MLSKNIKHDIYLNRSLVDQINKTQRGIKHEISYF
jgi:hypothetical protein